jgi:hypothetical protein
VRVNIRQRVSSGGRPRCSLVVLLPVAASAALLVSGCGVADNTTAAAPAPTVTVTVPGPTPAVTETATARITETVTPTSETQPNPAPRDAPDTVAPAPEQQEAGSDFDRQHAVDVVGDIIDDIKTVDFRLRDGIGVSTRLAMLSDDYDRLREAGTPPGTSPANYHARLSTLAKFAANAADDYDDNPTQGAASYAVVRKETAPLFAQLNSAVGTNFRLP